MFKSACVYFFKKELCVLIERSTKYYYYTKAWPSTYFVNDLVQYHHGEENGIIQEEMMINT